MYILSDINYYEFGVKNGFWRIVIEEKILFQNLFIVVRKICNNFGIQDGSIGDGMKVYGFEMVFMCKINSFF